MSLWWDLGAICSFRFRTHLPALIGAARKAHRVSFFRKESEEQRKALCDAEREGKCPFGGSSRLAYEH